MVFLETICLIAKAHCIGELWVSVGLLSRRQFALRLSVVDYCRTTVRNSFEKVWVQDSLSFKRHRYSWGLNAVTCTRAPLHCICISLIIRSNKLSLPFVSCEEESVERRDVSADELTRKLDSSNLLFAIRECKSLHTSCLLFDKIAPGTICANTPKLLSEQMGTVQGGTIHEFYTGCTSGFNRQGLTGPFDLTKGVSNASFDRSRAP